MTKYLKSEAEFDAHQHIVNALYLVENIISKKNNIDCYKFDIIKLNLQLAEMRLDYIRGKKWDEK